MIHSSPCHFAALSPVSCAHHLPPSILALYFPLVVCPSVHERTAYVISMSIVQRLCACASQKGKPRPSVVVSSFVHPLVVEKTFDSQSYKSGADVLLAPAFRRASRAANLSKSAACGYWTRSCSACSYAPRHHSYGRAKGSSLSQPTRFISPRLGERSQDCRTAACSTDSSLEQGFPLHSPHRR